MKRLYFLAAVATVVIIAVGGLCWAPKKVPAASSLGGYSRAWIGSDPSVSSDSGSRAASGVSSQSPSVLFPSARPSLVLGCEPGQGAEAVTSALLMGATVKRKSASDAFIVVSVPEGESPDAFAARLSYGRGIAFAEPDRRVHALLAATDPGYSLQWGAAKIGAPVAWDISRGAGVTVAVVDSGVDLDHPDLAGRLNTSSDYDFVNGDSTAQDDDGHGTHVAGTIAATLNNGVGVAGIANQCTILPVKVLGADGAGWNSDVADGVRWAADNGAKVINLSLGNSQYSTVVDQAIQYAIDRDCVVVAAAGNDGQYGVLYPAANSNVIGVGSTDSGDARSGFSNYGPGVDVTAPGTDVYSTTFDGGYGMMSGTSMATPCVAGVVALIRAKNPLWSRSTVEQQLVSTGLDLGVSGRDDQFGFGRVRADRALGIAPDDGSYRYTISSGFARIDGYYGPGGAVVIPATLGGVPVSEIGDSAFKGATGLTSARIPDGVWRIGDFAFEGCTNLANIAIPASVKYTGNGAFRDCSSLTTAIIPDGVSAINGYTFSGCTSLKRVTIPASVTAIGHQAFMGAGLTEIDIPEGVTYIGTSAFSGCASLSNVVIPSQVTAIASRAFYYCTSLISITLPQGVTEIGASAFSNCSSLTSITIPAGVTAIGDYAFEDCRSLSRMTIPDGVTSLGSGVFMDCVGLQDISIPASVPSFGNLTFAGCSKLTSVSIPAAQTAIGRATFAGCTNLARVSIPAGVTKIEALAFSDCSSLTSVTIPAGVTAIGEEAFQGCSSLTSITVPVGVTAIGARTFANNSRLATVTIPPEVTTIGDAAFENCGRLTDVNIPDGVTSIGYRLFGDCTSLMTVAIPASAETIERYAFSGCSSLTSVTIPSRVTGIGAYAFEGCRALQAAEFLGNAPTIGAYAFRSTAPSFTVFFSPGSAGFTLPPGMWRPTGNQYEGSHRTWYSGVNCQLTYESEQGGSISGTSAQSVKYGESGSAVTAVPDPGFAFSHWDDGVQGAVRTDGPLFAHRSVIAYFQTLPNAAVGTPVAPSVMSRGRTGIIYGFVAPRHGSGVYLVTLKFYKQDSKGKYLYHHSVDAKRYPYSSAKSKYKASVALAQRGKWRVRAYHSCGVHYGSYGGYDYIVVK